jgi:hypothetical protein
MCIRGLYLLCAIKIMFLRDDCPRGVLPGSGAQPTYFFYPELTTSKPCGEGEMHLDSGAPPGHMHNPAGLYGMLGDALTLFYAYFGDGAALAPSRQCLSTCSPTGRHQACRIGRGQEFLTRRPRGIPGLLIVKGSSGPAGRRPAPLHERPYGPLAAPAQLDDSDPLQIVFVCNLMAVVDRWPPQG